MTKEVNLYLVSDSSGETVLSVSGAVTSQFPNIKVNKYIWLMVRTRKEIDKLAEDVKKNPGIILYTIADVPLRHYLKEKCIPHGGKCISAISHIIQEFTQYIGEVASLQISGSRHIDLSEKYYNKIQAIEYTIAHDDGNSVADVNSADIVLVGVSRSSKSPTSFYLAQRGLKVANLPYIKGIGLGVDPKYITEPLVVGLVISSERLRQIRTARLGHLGGETFNKDYVDVFSINEEVREVKKIIFENNWPYIDVTGKAIEETAADIMNIYFEKKGAHHMIGW